MRAVDRRLGKSSIDVALRRVQLVNLLLVDVGASQHGEVGNARSGTGVAVVGARRLGRRIGVAAIGA